MKPHVLCLSGSQILAVQIRLNGLDYSLRLSRSYASCIVPLCTCSGSLNVRYNAKQIHTFLHRRDIYSFHCSWWTLGKILFQHHRSIQEVPHVSKPMPDWFLTNARTFAYLNMIAIHTITYYIVIKSVVIIHFFREINHFGYFKYN